MPEKFKNNVLIWLVSVSTILQLAALAYYGNYFDVYGYLPPPFLYDKHDTLMDFFNVLYWAGDAGRYSEWHSVYPPINFLFLQLVSWVFLGATNGLAPFALRDISAAIPLFICAAYLLLPLLVLRCKLFAHFKLWQKIIFYFFAISGAPFLFALERGNLILVVPVFLAMVLGESKFLRILSLAILINIKPYFTLLLIVAIAKRQWGEMVKITLCAAAIFFISGLILGGEFLSFFSNLIGFGQSDSLFSLREVMSFPSSVSAFSYVLKSTTLDFGFFDQEINILPYVANCIDLAKGALLVFAVLVVISKGALASRGELVAITLVMITNIGASVGGYSMLFYFLLLPILIEMRYRKFYVIAVCLLFMPLDLISLFEEQIGHQFAYISGESVFVTWVLGIGSVVRPLLNFLLLLTLVWEWIRKHRANVEPLQREMIKYTPQL